jgi:tetratricopeptide (TPR) repeat protein
MYHYAHNMRIASLLSSVFFGIFLEFRGYPIYPGLELRMVIPRSRVSVTPMARFLSTTFPSLGHARLWHPWYNVDMRKTGAYAVVGAVVVGAGAILWTCCRSVRVDDVLAGYAKQPNCTSVKVVYPQDGTLFPPEIVGPTVRWEDENAQASLWLVHVEIADGWVPIDCLCRERQWTPTTQEWERIKKGARQKEARVLVLGVRSGLRAKVVSAGSVMVRTSEDEVGAPVFYREVNLPFIDAVTDPSKIRWRFGSISSPEPPPVVLTGLPVCGNCHSFTPDGRILAMDVDYANSKGSYVITLVKSHMTLATSDIITWDDYRREDGEQTFGLLSQVSPDGRYVVSTVKDKSVFVPMPQLAFSQLFFPIKGILCVYDRQTKVFRALPGADDPACVQSNPSWSPDGKTIVFARARAYDLKNTKGQGKILLTREECKEFVEDGKPFLFDLYRVPFNDGQGGVAEPIPGASNNGKSNYFARYSPDGRWIVFCQAKSYMLLQKDSDLYIIPAAGGEARRLRCNTGRMNSWHSWSPNGKWLVFSSKAWSDYTQLCLTHIDENGRSTPPVLLDHLTSPDRAANIPEFVNAPPRAIAKIDEQFLNDYSFVRAGYEFYRNEDANNAIREYTKAVQLNPNNVEANQKLGFLLGRVKGRSAEGMPHLLQVLALDPHNVRAHYDLGMILIHQRKLDEAASHVTEALARMPAGGLDRQYSSLRLHLDYGQALLLAYRQAEAKAHLAKVLELDPANPQAHYWLAQALAGLGEMEPALQHCTQAIKLDPKVDDSPWLHHVLADHLCQKRQFRDAIGREERALALAQAEHDDALAARLQKTLEYYRRLEQAAQR